MNNFSSKDRALRSKLRLKLAQLIDQRKKLQSERAAQSDIESNEGEIDVIRKELKSIEDSGHTVFISAKKMLEPKKELSQKEKKISWKRKHLEIRLKSLRKDVDSEEKNSDQKAALNLKIQKIHEELKGLTLELNAVKDFNHTRFLGSQQIQGKGNEQEQNLKEIEVKMNAIREKIAEQDANIQGNDIGLLREKFHLLELEKEAIENFTHKEFLQNLNGIKSKRRSQLQ